MALSYMKSTNLTYRCGVDSNHYDIHISKVFLHLTIQEKLYRELNPYRRIRDSVYHAKLSSSSIL
jgi:hypothetical protein